MTAKRFGIMAIDGLALGAAFLLAAPFFLVVAAPFLLGM